MGKSSVAIERKMQKKRSLQSFGYTIFYGILLAGIAIALSLFLSGSAGELSFAIPRFLYDSIPGMLYIYNAVALVLMWLAAFLSPRPYQFQSLTNNAWNTLYKFGVRPGKLAWVKIRGVIFSQMFTYGFGFAISLVLGYVKSSDRTLDIRLLVSLALVGVFSLLILIMPTLAVGALSKGKMVLRLVVLLAGTAVGYLLYFNQYFICTDLSDISNSTRSLISLNPLGLVLIAAAFFVLFTIIGVSAAASRAKAYNVEDLVDEDLVELGVTGNMLVLTQGRNRYHVAISGPDINDTGLDIPVPPLADNSYESPADYPPPPEPAEKPKKERRSRRKRRDDEDEQDDGAY